MTSVVGILNKRGVAIAADSAVTRQRSKDGERAVKCTKNGNKMVRLCDAVPVAVMITGNADYLTTPWDVIVRRYRQKRGQVAHLTVEDAVHDFFTFIQSEPVFWGEVCDGYLAALIGHVFKEIVGQMNEENERKENGSLQRPAAFVRSFRRFAASMRKESERRGICPQFQDYDLDCFREVSREVFDSFMEQHDAVNRGFFDEDAFPGHILDEIRPDLEETVWMALRTRSEDGPSAGLIFAGFGREQRFPSLVAVNVCEGYDRHVNYHIRPEDIVCISDDRPVAICPFAQKDVIKSVLRGLHAEWSEPVVDDFCELLSPYFGGVFSPLFDDDSPGLAFNELLSEVKVEDLKSKLCRDGIRMLDKNQRAWEKTLEDSDLESMASLADSLIDLTGFHRILTFSQEGVGGPVDVAVISKNDGFTFLRRKSWYHKDGPMGV